METHRYGERAKIWQPPTVQPTTLDVIARFNLLETQLHWIIPRQITTSLNPSDMAEAVTGDEAEHPFPWTVHASPIFDSKDLKNSCCHVTLQWFKAPKIYIKYLILSIQNKKPPLRMEFCFET